jgi:hypothetical protein
MANNAQNQDFFEIWKKQMEEGAQMWARMVGQTGEKGPAATPDPLSLWRPFMEQASETWAKTVRPGGPAAGGAADMAAQGKAFLDQWISTWDKLLAETMQTEAFAQAIGKHLDQWLNTQGPMRKAAAEQTEATLQALGVPSRNQVIGLARQLMDLDDRIEDIEHHLAAMRAQLEKVLKQPAESRGAEVGPKPTSADKRKPKSAEKK